MEFLCRNRMNLETKHAVFSATLGENWWDKQYATLVTCSMSRMNHKITATYITNNNRGCNEDETTEYNTHLMFVDNPDDLYTSLTIIRCSKNTNDTRFRASICYWFIRCYQSHVCSSCADMLERNSNCVTTYCHTTQCWHGVWIRFKTPWN